MEVTTEFRSRPIMMHATSIRWILEGRKTQTRRIVKFPRNIRYEPQFIQQTCGCAAEFEANGSCIKVKNKYGAHGERLWVKEAWRQSDLIGPMYRADFDKSDMPELLKWRPAMLMPRVVARIILEVTSVRVERVQTITYSGITREGITPELCAGLDVNIDGELTVSGLAGVRRQFKMLWDETNGKGAWARNDYVWVVSFKILAAMPVKPTYRIFK